MSTADASKKQIETYFPTRLIALAPAPTGKAIARALAEVDPATLTPRPLLDSESTKAALIEK